MLLSSFQKQKQCEMQEKEIKEFYLALKQNAEQRALQKSFTLQPNSTESLLPFKEEEMLQEYIKNSFKRQKLS